MDDEERNARLERRRQVAGLIRAMAKQDDDVDARVDALAADADVNRVIGSLGVAGSTLARSLSQVAGRQLDDVLDELEQGLTSAPVE